MRKTLVTAVAVAALALTGCSQSLDTPEKKQEATQEASPAPTGSPEPQADSEVSEKAVDSKPFGDTWTYEDGLSFTVSKPKAFKPSEYAYIEDPKNDKSFVVMDVTIDNKSDEVYDSTLFTARATTGDREANAVFDTDKGVDTPMVPVQPGKSLKFKIAFAVDEGEDFVLYVSGDFAAHLEEGTYQ